MYLSRNWSAASRVGKRDLHLNRRAAGDQQQAGRGAQRTQGLGLVVALHPLRIGANRLV